jgi:hypothetical protein
MLEAGEGDALRFGKPGEIQRFEGEIDREWFGFERFLKSVERVLQLALEGAVIGDEETEGVGRPALESIAEDGDLAGEEVAGKEDGDGESREEFSPEGEEGRRGGSSRRDAARTACGGTPAATGRMAG